MRQFTQVGSVAAINRKGQQTYTWYDAQRSPVGYYRVKMVNREGAGSTTVIKKVALNMPTLEAMVYDDAAGGTVRVGVVSPERQAVTITVYSAAGQLVLRKDLTLQAGRQTHSLHGASLSRGTYYLVVGNERYLQRVGFVRR